MLRPLSALVLALLVAACARKPPAPETGGAAAVPPPRADGRLPRQARPTRYALDFVVDPTKERFSGRASRSSSTSRRVRS
jgi:hypothetical protein